MESVWVAIGFGILNLILPQVHRLGRYIPRRKPKVVQLSMLARAGNPTVTMNLR